ncbi:MAG TPA: hypothetical protein VEJ46_03155 [Candidatus Acidoferrum sp.]|nr:hypothetical protein [Candidatus Acidoferrum sp.]
MGNWFWQGTLTSVAATILWLGGATVLTWIRYKWPKYGSLALYWIASAACIGVLWLATTGYVPFTKHQPEVTPDNIEQNLKVWSEDLGIPYASQPMPDTYFAFSMTTRSGTQFQVIRSTKEKPAYLQFQSQMTLAPDLQALMGTLAPSQVEEVTQEVTVELAKSRVGFTMATASTQQPNGKPITQTVILLQKGAPIASLNEYNFSGYVDDIEFTAQLAKAATAVALKRTRIRRL